MEVYCWINYYLFKNKINYYNIIIMYGGWNMYGGNGTVQESNNDNSKKSVHDIVKKKPEKTEDLIPFIFIVDSFHRDKSKYPNANNYVINMPETIRDIVSIELLYAKFPCTTFYLNEYNNVLRYQQTQTQVTNKSYTEIVIPPGNWPLIELENMLFNALNDNDVSGGVSNYSITLNEYNQTWTLSKTVSDPNILYDEYRVFNLLFFGGNMVHHHSGNDETHAIYHKNSIGKFIGFSPSDFTTPFTSGSTASIEYTSDIAYDTCFNDYIVLHVNKDLQGDFDIIHSNVNNLSGAFAIINLTNSTTNPQYTKFNNSTTNDEFVKYFNPMLGSINKLHIELTNSHGDPYLFHGGEHVLHFRIMTRKNQTKE
jgi:hypothetical protein